MKIEDLKSLRSTTMVFSHPGMVKSSFYSGPLVKVRATQKNFRPTFLPQKSKEVHF
jgi:hypothetical protein